MNDEQKKWAQARCNELKQYIDKNFPLADEQWQSVINYIAEIVKLSKENKEIQNMLFDLVDVYQAKEKELLSAQR